MTYSFVAPQANDSTLNLGALAFVAPLLEQLHVADVIDQHLPPDPQLEYSHGSVLAQLLAARLCKPNAHINIPQWAHEHAADLLWGIPAYKLNHDRLGRARDAFFDKRHSIMTDVTVRVPELAELSLERIERLMTAERFLKAFHVHGITARAMPIGQILHASRLALQKQQILQTLRFPTPHRLLAQCLPLAPPEYL